MPSSSFCASGWNQLRRSRGFCDRAPASGYEGLSEGDVFVSGDSHIGYVATANYGHRRGYALSAFNSSGAHQQQFQPWRPSRYPIQAGPPPKSADHRNWIFAASQPSPDRERFKVLSYNILANHLAIDHQSNLYFHIPNHILAWEWRKRRLFVEFGLWSPDIMCLQEVDRFCDLEGELTIRGYAGIWKMRTGNAIDGCAIFWRTNRFQLMHEEHIEFNKLGLRDNVAQICVLESKRQYLYENAVSLASHNQLSGSNQVVVCNTHVLYNPKRGEIKLGQVRVLLNRAFTISRAWNDAPVIVCGDFNSIPMSPLYKFIATQNLNLLGLARDQISGQYSATLYRRPNSPYNWHRPLISSGHVSENMLGAEEGYCKTQADDQHIMESTSAFKKSDVTLHQDSELKACAKISCVATIIKSGEEENFNHQSGVNVMNGPCSEGNKISPPSVNLEDEIKATSMSCVKNSITSALHNDANYNFQIDSKNVGNPPSFHRNKDYTSSMDSNVAVITLSEDKPYTFTSLEVPVVGNIENSSIVSAVSKKTGSLSTCHSFGKGNAQFEGSHISDRIGAISCIEEAKIKGNLNSEGNSKTSASEQILEEMPDLHVNICRDATSSENSNFSELPSTEENADPNFYKDLLGMEDDHQILNDFCSVNSELHENTSFPRDSPAFNEERRFYHPYCWSPMEMEIASGKAKCTAVEHPLKLRSVYTDVEDYAGTKDSSREPQVTSYNQQFMGTVDYIWCSEDLQTVKVLDTIPKHVLQRTLGFPTPKWGSDHIALVCELAFSKGSQNK